MITASLLELDSAETRIHLADAASGVEGDATLSFDRLESPLAVSEGSLLAAAVALVAGQASLSPQIILTFALEDPLRQILSDIASVLYGAHAFAQRVGWREPTIACGSATSSGPLPPAAAERRAVLLWSGGKDGIAALRLLRKNGYEVHGLHATANFRTASQEHDAAQSIAAKYALPLTHLTIKWDVVHSITKAQSTAYDRYPMSNSVPHGRDLPLLVAGACVANRLGAGFVCAGYEYDLWAKSVRWQEQSVARHDIQSKTGGRLVNSLLEEFNSTRFFSPIAAVHEFVILRWLLESEPHLWQHIESCFWGGWCGECTKCLRYCLVQRVLGVDCIRFRKEPLDATAPAFVRLVESLGDSDSPYWEQQVYCLAQLATSGDSSRGDNRVALPHFAVEAAAPYAGQLPALLTTLTSIVADDLAPQGFAYRL